jgi:hypothetical protein
MILAIRQSDRHQALQRDALVTQSKEVEPSLGIRLLADMRTVFGYLDEMPSKTVLEQLHGMRESPWNDLKGKPLDERALAHRLRQYGIKSKTIRIGATTAKGYCSSDFVDVWARYVPLPPATSVTGVISVTDPAVFEVPNRVVSDVTLVTLPGRDGADSTPSAVKSITSATLSLGSSAVDVGVGPTVTDVTHPAGDERRCAHCRLPGGTFCEASVGGQPIALHVGCKDAFRP